MIKTRMPAVGVGVGVGVSQGPRDESRGPRNDILLIVD